MQMSQFHAYKLIRLSEFDTLGRVLGLVNLMN